MKKTLTSLSICLIYIFNLSTALALDESPDSTGIVNSTVSISGIESLAHSPNYFRGGLNALFFVPRETISGATYLLGRGLYAATKPEVIEYIEGFLFFYEKRLGWYPSAELDSEFRPEVGVKVFYRSDILGASFQGKYANSDRWRQRVKLRLDDKYKAFPWKISITGEKAEEDDRIYYGIGNDPSNDPRSRFLKTAEHENAVYKQDRRKLQLLVSKQISPCFELSLTSLYREREVISPSEGDNRLDHVFDVPALEFVGQNVKMTYSEISARYDSRNLKQIKSGGYSASGYFGYSGGVDNDISFLRSGFDFSLFIPVLRHNRLIVPSLTLNALENLNDEAVIPFTEYPRHLNFRGVSSRRLLRLDNYSFVPSLEYRWPLTYTLTGYLFTDFLIVSETLDEVEIDKAPWAFGTGMTLQIHHADVAGFQAVYGSEGIRVTILFGSSFDKPERCEWR